jgi:SAM-dependent methyltransferase
MSLREWDERHRSADQQTRPIQPTPLVKEFCQLLPPGNALDLACGRGGNSLWLAQKGWRVTATDGSQVAIEIVKRDAAALGAAVDACVADLDKHEFTIAPSTWNLILICSYYQPDLYEKAIRGLAPGGTIIASALLATPGKHRFRVETGQFAKYFSGLEILRNQETNGAHPIAEIVARRSVVA